MAYCDLTDLKAWLSIPDTDDDPILSAAAPAASQWIDAYTGRSFTVASGTSTYYIEPRDTGWVVQVPDFASTSGLVVETTSDHSTWTATTDFQPYPLNSTRYSVAFPYDEIRFLSAPPWPYDARPTIRVTAAYGWTAVPTAVEQACKIQASRWFRRKDTPEGIAAGAEFGAIRVNSKLDPDVCALLDPFRKGGHAAGLVVG